ncbi:MAG: D-alanine--D-alanine ligase family protein [Acidobacteriota bacterium]
MAQRIGLVFGGRSVEHKVSVVSARTVDAALASAGFTVVPLGIAQSGAWVAPPEGRRALDGELDELGDRDAGGRSVVASLGHLVDAQVDVVFPIAHGTWGEDGTLQGLCEMLDLPYVGTGVASSAVCMDKLLSKQVLAASGLPVVDFEAVDRRGYAADPLGVARRVERLGWPLFVKPAIGGSSVGVRKVSAPSELEAALEHGLRFDDRLVVEKAIAGRELECAVLGYGELVASGIGEIVPGNDFYDYADKYLDDGAELIHAAELDPGVEDELRRLAIESFDAVGGWGMARVDFLLDEAGPAINEINTLPGFTSISMYPKLWQRAGVAPPELVTRLVEIAERRHADRRRLDDGIKDWIAQLGG